MTEIISSSKDGLLCLAVYVLVREKEALYFAQLDDCLEVDFRFIWSADSVSTSFNMKIFSQDALRFH